jgi:hypothetical protein
MASIASTPQTGLYLYGITLAGDSVSLHPSGVAGACVEEIVERRLAALTSRLAVQKVRPQRSNLAAHHLVLSELSNRQPVLPVVFGTIADGEEELHDFMRQNYDALIKKLNRLQGMMEMTLKVYWETANIFEYFVANHRELEEMRNRLFQPGRTPTIEEKIQLGKLFESLSEQSRRRHTQRVIEALSPYCREIRSIDPNEERMIMKLACLVEKTHRQQWENGVEAAAHAFDNHYCFKYSGPWAPYNFAEIELTPGS